MFGKRSFPGQILLVGLLVCVLGMFCSKSNKDEQKNKDTHASGIAEKQSSGSLPSLPATDQTLTTSTTPQPPRFTKMVKTNATVGELFVDTLVATDPNGYPIVYSAKLKPKGFTLDSKTGIVSFTPKNAGVFPVTVTVKDSAGLSLDQQYTIVAVTVGKEALVANLVAPSSVGINEQVVLDASQSVNNPDGTVGLLFRFDTNGDKQFDVPTGGDFGKEATATTQFSEQGEYALTVEIKNASGKTSVAKHTVNVNAPPAALLTVNKNAGPLETVFAFDASGSSDGKDKSDKLTFEWNFGDTLQNASTTDAKITHTYAKSGSYTATVTVKDRKGAASKANTVIEIFGQSGIDSLAFPDSASVNKQISFVCVPFVSDVKIVEYSWDFDTDNVSDKTGAEAKVGYTYKKEGSYVVTCTIRDEKGQSAKEQKKIFIGNAKTVLDAKGPYSARVNAKISFTGTALDEDNTIVSYSWDFDGDGKSDWNSAQSANTQYSMPKSGVFKCILTVKTDDGKSTSAESKVTVINEPPMAFAGEDIISSKGKKVALKGNGRDLEGKIALYQWDFDSDGKYDWSSKDTGFTTYEFIAYSKPVLRVTDSDGATDTDTLNIIICPQGMELIKEGKFCIDNFEFPNKNGQVPTRSITWQSAQEECKKQGKYLCSAAEWTTAYSGVGNDKTIYPYGDKFNIENCNTLGNPWSHNTPSKSGEFSNCKSKSGVMDMSGNVAEWTSDTDKNGAFVYGGSYLSSEKESRGDSKVLLDKSKKFFYVGFRCCK